MKVYKAIVSVQEDLSKVGIGKDRKNDQQGYKFRGIDDVYNELAPIISKHGLCILPRMLSRECVEKVNSKGTTLFYTIVDAEFDFVSSEDGSKHTVKTYGEAMDSGDKSTNKAMSAAYKYAAFQAFCIPTEGDNDADASTHIIKPAAVAKPAQTLDPAVLESFANSKDLKELATAWGAIDVGLRSGYTEAKEKRKKELSNA